MIQRIVLENYMSHARTVIEPAAGVTVIVGPNNCGKSAIASALQTLCGDHDGDFMVRHGEKNCQVSVETDDGHTIVWRRKGKAVSYVLDEVEVHRVGRGKLPDDLQTLLRLPKVAHANGDKQFDVHFGEQKSPIFLIDKESDTAAFFSTASDAQKLLEIQKLHKTKASDARKQHAQTTAELTDLDAQLAALAPLDQLEKPIEEVEREQQDLSRDAERLVALDLLISEMEKRAEVRQFHQKSLAAMIALEPPPPLHDTAALESLLTRLERASRQASRCAAEARTLKPLEPAPELADVSPLARDIEMLERAARVRQAVDSQSAALAQLADPPELADPTPLRDFLIRYSSASLAARAQRQALQEIQHQLQAFEADFALWHQANPNCPTCGAPITREHVFSSHGAPQGAAHA